jgi:membrane-bound metal-dependent hydrolase YbcI (DUF457 family)
MVVDGARRLRIPAPWPWFIVLAASAADLDFLPGILTGYPDRFHHGASHSLFAAAIAGLLAAALLRWAGVRHARAFGVLVALSYATHLLLDMTSADSRSLTGVPLFWPLWRAYVHGPFDVFIDIRHVSAGSGFVTSLLSAHNATAVWREVLVMGTIAAIFHVLLLAVPRRPGADRRDRAT